MSENWNSKLSSEVFDFQRLDILRFCHFGFTISRRLKAAIWFDLVPVVAVDLFHPWMTSHHSRTKEKNVTEKPDELMLVHNITTQSSFRVLFSPQGVCVNFCTLREPSNCLHMKARPSISKSFTFALSWFFEKTCFLDLFWNETSLFEFYSVDEIYRTKRIEWVIRVHKAEKLNTFLAEAENFKRSGTSSNSAKIDYESLSGCKRNYLSENV